MKIIKVNQTGKKALFVFEEFPTSTFQINMNDFSSLDQIKADLKQRFKTKKDKQIINVIDVKSLEGVDIDA